MRILKNYEYNDASEEEIESLKRQEELNQSNDELDQIKQQITDLQLALTELYEGGQADG